MAAALAALTVHLDAQERLLTGYLTQLGVVARQPECARFCTGRTATGKIAAVQSIDL
jgi:hypothetical protein